MISVPNQTRREWFNFALTTAATAFSPNSAAMAKRFSAEAAGSPNLNSAPQISDGLSVNWDNTAFFSAQAGGPKGPAIHPVDVSTLNQLVDQYAHTEVGALIFSVNSQRTSYATKAKGWQPMWQGFHPDKGPNQPLLESTGADARGRIYAILKSAWDYDRKGIDVYEKWIERCKKWGISSWLSMRMNDIHYSDDEKSWAHSDMWRNHPELRTSKGGGLNYETPEVRERSMALIDELIERYQFDGLELDWMRFPNANFKGGRYKEGAVLLTDFTRQVREKLTKKRGKSVMMSARVPSHPAAALGWGFDAVTWAKDGLVDQLVVSPLWGTIEFDMPIDEWKSKIAGSGVKIVAGLETLIRPFPASPLRLNNTSATVRGAAASLLDLGAQGIYLFNYFNLPGYYSSMSKAAEYPLLLTEIGRLSTLAGKGRRQILTYQDFAAPGQSTAAQLPVAMSDNQAITLHLATGPKPSNDQAVTVRLALKNVPAGVLQSWHVAVNGKPAKYLGVARKEPPMPPDPLYEFEVGTSSLTDRYSDINIVPKVPSEAKAQIEWAEIAIGASGGG